MGSRLAACLRIYNKAVLCDGQGTAQEELKRKLSTITECVSWVCEDAFDGPRMSNGTQRHAEGKWNFGGIDVPCVIQWSLLWFSSYSRLNQTFTNNGTKVAKYREAVTMAIDATVTMPFEGLHTPRTCLLRSVCAVLYRPPDEDWNVEEEMKGWGLGESPCLPPYDNDWDDDISDA